ncbi:MAG: Ribonuclease HII [Syntrophomonadaceae bacterium]|nr:Ribonuclease HII [Bacillota bacterium]
MHVLNFEIEARKSGYHLIAGVDEAGRGPLAGPVFAAAVILPENVFLPGVNDSKLLSPAKREKLYQEIVNQALAWSTGIAAVSEIDSLNILQATRLAMLRALTDLSVKPDYILLDALRLEGLECPQRPVIGGDRLSQSIAAASIVAKVARDRLMREMDSVFPGYGFARHKGYGTPEHYRALSVKGSCPLHRQSFLPDAGRKRR